MAEKSEKKLQLNKETIRNLSDESLEQVAGGRHKSGSVIIACSGILCGKSNVGCSLACNSVLC